MLVTATHKWNQMLLSVQIATTQELPQSRAGEFGHNVNNGQREMQLWDAHGNLGCMLTFIVGFLVSLVVT